MKKFNFQKVTLSADEKVRFHQRMTIQMTGYLWIPLCLLLIFQLYNIGYVLYYTDFALRSEASKVYFIMYLAMFSVLVAAGIQLRFLASDWSWRLTLRSIWALTAFILLWALCITVYDQRTSDNISVYTQMTLSIAVLIYMPPKVFLPLFLSTQALFMLFLPLFQTGEFGDNYGIYVNSIWSTLIAVFVCYYHYYTALRSFKGDLIIEENTSLLMENNRKLDDLAKRDQLTQTYNRRYLASYLEELCQKPDKQAVEFYMIDIDDFKRYNDHFGHVSGDVCLQKVAAALQEVFQDGCLFRFGGEEFLGIIAVSNKDASFGEAVCQSIRDLKLASPVSGKDVTISVGAARGIVDSEAAWESLLKEADTALYTAKKNGKNQIIYRLPESGREEL